LLKIPGNLLVTLAILGEWQTARNALSGGYNP